MKKNLLLLLNIFGAISCIGLATKLIVLPYAAGLYYGAQYKELVFQCDNVMRDHLIAKNRVNNDKTMDSIRQLHAAEVGLLTCNDYDKLRKKMAILGITDEQLSLFGIEAIEAKSNDVRNFVKTHEFKY